VVNAQSPPTPLEAKRPRRQSVPRTAFEVKSLDVV